MELRNLGGEEFEITTCRKRMDLGSTGIRTNYIEGAGSDAASGTEDGEIQLKEFNRKKTLTGAGEVCFRGLDLRLVSLWWELPPRLDSNNRILILGMQLFLEDSVISITLGR